MSIQRQEQVIALLQASSEWQTANELASRLGVSSRSVRGYVAAINAASGPEAVVVASPLGYRLSASSARLPTLRIDETPEGRRRMIARRFATTREPVNLFTLADELFVSSATIEADVAKVRADLAALGIKTRRSDTHVFSTADEPARRQALYRLLQSSAPGGIDVPALHAEFPDSARTFAPLRRSLTTHLAAVDELVNDFVMTGVTVLTLIAIDRVSAGYTVDEAEFPAHEAEMHLANAVSHAVHAVVGVTLPAAELTYLVRQILVRGAVVLHDPVAPEIVQAVAAATDEATARFGVEPIAPQLLHRLASHVERLRVRSATSDVSHNPLTRSLKSTYPLLFDIAVSVGSALSESLAITIEDDEIAYLALHIGAQWEQTRHRTQRPTAVLVSPGYHQLHQLLRDSIERAVGSSLQLVAVHADGDVDWAEIDSDIVLTTLPPPIQRDGVVEISPFLTDNDVERVHLAIARARRATRRAKLHDELSKYLLPEAFVPALAADLSQEDVIRLLGDRLIAAGVIDAAYVESTLERERASSTAFTPTLAVPHAQTMSATRTAVAIGLAQTSLAWGEGSRVQVVAFVAFSAADRDAFQTIFEQFVEVFTSADAARRLVKAGASAQSFTAELAAIIDE